MDRVCPDEETLAAWVEGALAPAPRARVSDHLSRCDACRRASALAAALDPAPAAAVDEALLDRVVAASRRRPAWRWVAAAAALLAGGLAVALGRPAPPAAAPRIAEAPPVAPVAPAPVARTADPMPVPPPAAPEVPPPAPVAVVPPAPPPAPAPAPPPPAPAPLAKVEDAPKPEAPKVDVAPKPKVGETDVDLARLHGAVFLGDPAGDLWLTRGDAVAAKAGPFEQLAWKDVVAAKGDVSGFTLDGRATLVLDKAASAGLAWFKPDQAYRLDLREGTAVVDTDGASQKWIVAAGRSSLRLPLLKGRLSVEPRGDGVRAVLLEGSAATPSGPLEPGREVVLSADGRLEEGKAEGIDRLAKLLRSRPKASTLFAAGFDERKTVAHPFPYTIVVGRVKEGPAGPFLEAESGFVPTETAPFKPFPLTAALKPDRLITTASDLLLKFRYRTTLSSLGVRLREPDGIDGTPGAEYALEMPSRSAGRWADAELRLDGAFRSEGVPLIPLRDLAELRFSGISDRKGGVLEVDAVQFVRRAR